MPRLKSSKRKELESIGIQRARETRGALGLGKGPISDIFSIIEQHKILLLRHKASDPRLHAFFAEIKGHPVIFINSDEPLGRQYFSAAHEFCHFLYDRNSLKGIYCDPGNSKNNDDEIEIIADAFAGEFLMPIEGLEDSFRKFFGHPTIITEKHIIKMQQFFKVSYAAMAYSLFKAGILKNGSIYGKLKKLGNIENTEELKFQTKRLGYTSELNEPTSPYFPHIFLEAVTSNFENGIITYGKLESLLELWGKTPSDYGLEPHDYYDD
ncbi:ImmA/IrrE family metallo-endopeptidase [Peptococcaceae bacterium 1198_IL3148]